MISKTIGFRATLFSDKPICCFLTEHNVVNPMINLPFGNGFSPFLAILGIVNCWVRVPNISHQCSAKFHPFPKSSMKFIRLATNFDVKCVTNAFPSGSAYPDIGGGAATCNIPDVAMTQILEVWPKWKIFV